MSENLVSEPMIVEDSYGSSRMYPVNCKQDSSIENILMESQGPLNFNSTTPQLSIPDMKGLQNEQLKVAVSQEMPGSQFDAKPLGPFPNNKVAPQILVPNWPMQRVQAIETNSEGQKSLLPNKRKATLDNDPSTKKVAQSSSLFNSGMPAVSVPNKKVVPMWSMSNSPKSMSNSPKSMVSSKKKLTADSVVNRSQPLAPKNRNALTNPPAKAQAESSNSMRSKLRESLAAALALVCQEHDSAEKNDHCLVESKDLRNSLTPTLASHAGDGCISDPGKAGESTIGNEESKNIKSSSETVGPKHIAGDTVETWKFVGQEFQSNPVLTYEDASFNDGFFGKDELLLGNGLAWEMELNPDIAHVKEALPSDKVKLAMLQDTGNAKELNLPRSEPLPSPESVASKIELELFKFFGGVNKKYKEKGRSLLFNLKDKSNPELRERVISGEIPPEKLCSMTAEELASKELSEWRIAKAEELSLMKVLPDEEVDLRRLVKKTHKGEFVVVEVERDVSTPVDIALGASTLSADQPKETRRKTEHSRVKSLVRADEAKANGNRLGKKSNNEKVDGQCQLTISSDSGDVMHALMVDDMKDLPPIVSLDEFMEDLDKEPPFENLHDDSGTTLDDVKETSDVGGDTKSSDQTSKEPGKKIEPRSDGGDSKSIISNTSLKSASVHKRPEIHPATGLIKGERIWEGLLQLTISSMANFVGIYKSGEKTSTKDWPSFFEIKGRVRLDAFQKFLQDLPMSRSRAVMVIHFALAEECTDDDHKNLQELVDSYVADNRLGFAEPAPGFEIYYIPPQKETLELLSKQLKKDYTETLKTIDNGLIGIVVWRKVQLTPTTPHKDNAKKQQQPSNVGFASRSVVPSKIISRSQPDINNNVDDDDDAPPGFGPPTTARDDDDLPEFKFSGAGGRGGPSLSFNPPVPQSLSSPTPSSSVDQVRQLIQKYGKGENGNVPSPSMRGGIPLQSWDDDDDDIPEWQPDGPAAQPPMLPPQHMANYGHLQQQVPSLAKPSVGGGWWPGGPTNSQPSHNLQAQNQGRQYEDAYSQQSRQWRSDGHRSSARGR